MFIFPCLYPLPSLSCDNILDNPECLLHLHFPQVLAESGGFRICVIQEERGEARYSSVDTFAYSNARPRFTSLNWNAAVFKFEGTPKSPARFGFARFANKVDSHVPLPEVVIRGIRVGAKVVYTLCALG